MNILMVSDRGDLKFHAQPFFEHFSSTLRTEYTAILILKRVIYNFNPGPAALPAEVKEELSVLIRGKGQNVSIIEISHRSKEFINVLEETRSLILELAGLSEKDYTVLILQGGASLGFHIIPLNFLGNGRVAGYINTGVWSSKAIDEARKIGKVDVVPEGKPGYFLPDVPEWFSKSDFAYVHITTNETIMGTMWHEVPEVSAPLVGDMSSDIMGRKVEFEKFSLIYAGAQKNMGPAGATVYIIRKAFIEEHQVKRELPNILNLKKHIDEGSLYNTPCVFAIYGVWLTMKWLKKMGGVERMSENNMKKASLLYDYLDRSTLFYPFVKEPRHRSVMNVTFGIQKKELEEEFLRFCAQEGIIGIRGHRSAGGFRASLYNAVPLEWVHLLVDVMRHFEEKYG